MESTNDNNNNELFLSELKKLRNELSDMKKQIVQLEKSHLKQQERLDILERENHALKTKTRLNNLDGNKEVESALKRKRTEKDQDQEKEKETESKSKSTSASVSDGKKKPKTNDNDDKDVVLPLCDNGDSFDSLSDDLLHKIVEFNGNCYSVYGLINKRCKNIYDMKEYKLKKETCVYGYGTVDMMLQRYLRKRREGTLDAQVRHDIARVVIYYNRLDAIDWIIQLGDVDLLKWVCSSAACYGRINILTKVYLHSNLTMLDELLNCAGSCHNAAGIGKLETLKWLRKYGAEWDANTFAFAIRNGHDEIIQYLRAEGCPEQHEDTDESSGIVQFGSDDEDEDGDY